MKRLSSLVLTLTLLLSLTACSAPQNAPGSSQSDQGGFSAAASSSGGSQSNLDASASDLAQPLDPARYYYDLESVVLYLDSYDALPPNYITKGEARELGWEGGSVEAYRTGAAIGGDSFGNREGLLPKETGRRYTECDLNTDGLGSRGAERLVFSSDGLYFYTRDHYESFDPVRIENGQVALG